MKYLCYHEPTIDDTNGRKFLSRNEMRKMALDMINNARDNNYTRLTKADAIAWWEFIKLCMPANYERAIIHKKIQEDVNIGDIDGVEKLNINDYFELYSLPRVTAENGIVSVNGVPKIRYANRMNYFRRRNIFTIAHSDRRFYIWKKEQLNNCQDGRCAWCGEHIKMHGSHVDHVLPLIFFGKNEPWNLVVTCEECNKIKSSDARGWNEVGDRLLGNKKPSWITKNKYDALLKKIMIEAENKYEEEEHSGSHVLINQRVVA